MKAINGKLDMSKSYKLVSVEYGELSEAHIGQCENCGQIIANIAVVEDNAGKQFRIGLDCMATIVNMPASDIQQAKNIVNRTRDFIKHVKNAVFYETYTPSDGIKGFVFYEFSGYGQSIRMGGKGLYSKYESILKSIPELKNVTHNMLNCLDRIDYEIRQSDYRERARLAGQPLTPASV